MALWTIIYDFISTHIFPVGAKLGANVTTSDTSLSVAGATLTLQEWLCSTLTIIVLCAMCFFLFLVTRWLFRLFAGLLAGRG